MSITNPGTNPSPATYTVNVVRDDASWCAAVVGEDVVVWGTDFEDLEAAVRSRLAEIRPGDEPELTWQIDTGGDTGREVPLSPM